MKKKASRLALLLAGVLCLLAACGNGDKPASAVSSPSAAAASSSGGSVSAPVPLSTLTCTIDDMGMNQLMVTTDDGTQFPFSIEGTSIEDGVDIDLGQRITVHYTGEPGEESFQAVSISAG